MKNSIWTKLKTWKWSKESTIYKWRENIPKKWMNFASSSMFQITRKMDSSRNFKNSKRDKNNWKMRYNFFRKKSKDTSSRLNNSIQKGDSTLIKFYNSPNKTTSLLNLWKTFEMMWCPKMINYLNTRSNLKKIMNNFWECNKLKKTVHQMFKAILSYQSILTKWPSRKW